MLKEKSARLAALLTRKPVQPIAWLTAIASMGLIIGGSIFFTQACPTGQARQNGSCAIASSDTAFETTLPTYMRIADVPNVPKGVVKYSGSKSFAAVRSSLFTDKIAKDFPQLVLKYVSPANGKVAGSASGIDLLLEGQIDVAQSSRPLTEEERDRAKQQGVELVAIPVAKDGIAFYVNPRLSVPGLTLEQIRQIYSGNITNWQDVGGSNVPIQPYMLDPKVDGTASNFKTTVMKSLVLSSSVELLSDNKESIRKVGQNSLGGIAFASTNVICPQTSVRLIKLTTTNDLPVISPCNGEYLNQDAMVAGRYPLTQDLYVVFKKDGGSSEQAGTAYANVLRSRQAQDTLLRFNLIPIL
jgi:phosphate transport system substrate-binding protein